MLRPRRALLAPLSASLGLALTGGLACGEDVAGPTGAGAGGASSTGTATSGAPSSSVAAGGGGRGGAGGGASSSASGGGSELPDTFVIEGVVTDGGRPLEGAFVMQGGGDVQQVTGADGAFVVTLTRSLPGTPTVVAGKEGYRARGKEIYELPAEPVELDLLFAAPPDDESYAYGPPGTGEHDDSTEFCGHCHTTFVETFRTSGHAHAVRHSWIQDLYAGVATARSEVGSGGAGGHGEGAGHAGGPPPFDAGTCADVEGEMRPGKTPGTESATVDRCYVGDGVLPDLNGCGAPGELACDDPALPPAERPTRFGACADCHGAGMDGPAGGRDLLEAVGVGYESGVHCDACHHIRDVDLTKPPGTAGRLVLQRPRERVSDEPGAEPRQIMFGPLRDVPNTFMGGSYQPDFLEATLCAGCHEQRQPALVPGDVLDESRWPDGLPVHSTYEEWSQSDYAPGAPCQTCHMPPITGMFNSVNSSTPEGAGTTDGFGRPPERNRSHAFVGALQGEPRMIDQALAMLVDAVPGAEPGRADVDVTLVNVGAGHAVPTGEPMRSLVVVVLASACGEVAEAIEGNSIDDGGGALATGIVGVDVEPNLTWPEGARFALAGRRLRVARPTGAHLDYPGVGWFAAPERTAEDKGIPVEVPVADVEITGVIDWQQILTVEPVALQPGDRVYVGEPPRDRGAPGLVDGAPVHALAGLPGQVLGRVLADASGRRHVPHHRAVDLVSDHRVPPSSQITSSHAFLAPDGCDAIEVEVHALYRRAPLGLARERGWDVRENVVATTSRVVPVR